MKRTKGIIIVAFSLFFIEVSAQQNYSQDYIQHRIPCDSVVYHLNIFNPRMDTFPNSMHNEDGFWDKMLPFLNAMFAPTCISFKACKMDTIFDYNYYKIRDEASRNEIEDIVNMNYYPYSINVYWNYDYDQVSFNGICQSSNLKPRIFVKDLEYPTFGILTFTRQVLRYFGLPYTSSTMSSKELVDASNGTWTADSFWDTPADPYLLVSSSQTIELPPNPLSYFYYNTIKDVNGDYYNPMYNNFMAHYNYNTPNPVTTNPFGSTCEQLTKEQYQYIIRNERRCRKIRWE